MSGYRAPHAADGARVPLVGQHSRTEVPSTLSNSIVALAFVGQATEFGTPFYTWRRRRGTEAPYMDAVLRGDGQRGGPPRPT
jgi:hypothetical protein